MNLDKLDVEGEFAAEQLIWGLHMSFDTKVVRLSEQKCIKAQYLLAMPELRGSRKVPLKLAQELRGCAQFWATAQPSLRPELSGLDRLLCSGTSWAQPKGTPEEKELAWSEWDSTIELMRVMFEAPESWSSTFRASFSQALSVRELLAPPGVSRKTRWTGGGATMESIGAIDWGRATTAEEKGPPEYIAADARPLLETLSRVVAGAGAEEEWIIAVVELLAIVALATRQGEKWRDELIFYVTDNQNVRSWLARRNPKNPLARHLIRLVERLEAKYDFHITSLFVRTYHNEVADWLTREEVKKVHDDLKRAGWIRLEPPAE